jgi:hypothetical protein
MLGMKAASKRNARLVTLATLWAVVALCSSAGGGELPLIHCSDTASWNSAKWGRAALLKSLGLKQALLLSTGGSLSASGRPAGDADAFPVRMLSVAGFDVVNVAHRDLTGAAGAKKLLAAMQAEKRVRFVSGNVTLASGGAPWKPYVVVRGVAVIGVAARSRALLLPGADAFPGVRVSDPEKAIEKALAKLKGKAARVVLLADAPPALVKKWLGRFKAIDLALVSARGGAPMRVPGEPRLLGSPAGGTSLSVVARNKAGKLRATDVVLIPPGKLSSGYSKAAGEFRVSTTPVAVLKSAAAQEFVNRPLVSLESGKLVPTALKVRNRAAVLEVTSVLVAKKFGARSAPEGRRFLVISTRWENILEPQVVREKKLPVAYMMKKLSDHLYLVVDGDTVVPAAKLQWPDQIGPGKFLLAGPGSVRNGKLIYELPTDKVRKINDIQLRHYDYAHGSMAVTIYRRKGAGTLARPKPVKPPVKNELVELAVFKMQRSGELAGRKPPAGCEFLSMELRSRSCLVFDADATAYDPKAKAGDKIKVGTVCDWKDWQRYLYLVVDGEYAVSADTRLSRLPRLPRYLPDILTGHRIVFAVPAGAKSVQLRFSYPHAATPDKGVITPKPLAVDLLGSAPKLGKVAAAATVIDEKLTVSLGEGQAAKSFNGMAAGRGRKWYVCRVTIENKGTKGEFIQSDKQFEYIKADARKVRMDSRVLGSAYAPAKLILVPPGERRSFTAAWLVPESEKKPRVAYKGYSLAKTLTMKPLDGEPVAAVGTGSGKTPVTPKPPKDPVTPKPPKDPVATKDPVTPTPAVKPPVLKKTELRKWKAVGKASNRALELTVKSLELVEKLGSRKAGTGLRFLVAEVRWKRTIDNPALSKAAPWASYLRFVPEKQLFCVINRDRLLPVSRISEKPLIHPGYEVAFNKPAHIHAGKMAWVLPDTTDVRCAELFFYDSTFGNFKLVVLDDPKLIAAKPLATARNEVMEVALYSQREVGKYGRSTADKGMKYVVLDLGFKSLAVTGGRGGGKSIAAPLVWTYPRRFCQLLVNGYRPVERYRYTSSFGNRSLMRLPTVTTRYQVVYSVPEKTQSLELECGAPSVVLPGRAPAYPRAARLLISGKVPPAPEIKPVVTIDDGGLRMELSNPRMLDEVHGRRSGGKHDWLSVDVWLQNRGKTAEVLDISQRLRYRRLDGALRTSNSVALSDWLNSPGRGPRWIPRGGQRRFRMIWYVEAANKTPLLRYTGTLESKLVDILKGKAFPLQTGETLHFGKIRPVRKDLKPKGLAGVGLKPEQVNAAIDKGRAWLWKYLWEQQLDKGRNEFSIGQDTLALVALVHSDAHKKYPEFDRQLKRFLRNLTFKRRQTYEVGLLATLVEHYGNPEFEPVLKQATRYLLETQGRSGRLNYHSRDRAHVLQLIRAQAPNRAVYSRKSGGAVPRKPVLEVSGGVPVEEPGAAGPTTSWYRRSKWAVGADGDNSITQFAMLGMWAANRSRLKISPDVWRRCLETTRKYQCADGGWAYSGSQSKGYGSMSCAGICTLAICLEHLGRKPLEDLQVQEGLKWFIANKWKFGENTRKKKAHLYYYIYSIERMGRILGIDFIGDVEWYPVGAKYLVAAQGGKGDWRGGNGETNVLRTSFALLFLTRATPSFKPKPKPKEGDGFLEANVIMPAGMRYYIILDASGSMLAKKKLDVARGAILELLTGLHDDSQVALRVYGNRQRAINLEGELNRKANTDSTLEIKMTKLDRKVFKARLMAMRARGKTPIAYSLDMTARDLSRLRVSEKAPVMVVLLTDGGEDTIPRKNPVKAAAKLAKIKGVTLNIVGFDIGRKDWQKQLLAMSKAAGGQYWTASKPELLSARLKRAAVKAPPGFEVLDAKGKKVADGQFGVPLKLRQGKYVFRTRWKGHSVSRTLWVNTDGKTRIVLDIGEMERRARKTK